MTSSVVGVLIGFIIGYALKSYEVRKGKAKFSDMTTKKYQ